MTATKYNVRNTITSIFYCSLELYKFFFRKYFIDIVERMSCFKRFRNFFSEINHSDILQNFKICSPANFFRKNREFRRILALFCVNAGYIYVLAILLHSLALFYVLSHGFTFSCNFTFFFCYSLTILIV